MCCAGCAAVAQAIDESGLGAYYQHRTARPGTVDVDILDQLNKLRVYDHKEIQRTFVTELGESRREADLILEGIQCAACVWLNERHLQSLPGVIEVSVNYSNHQARVVWDNDRIKLSDILGAINNIGYNAHPFDPNRQRLAGEQQRKALLKKVGVTAAIGMQVMILAVALYNGDWYGMDEEYRTFFRRFSLLLTLPVLLYSGREFFQNAWLDLKLRRVSMDVPVAIGIGLAFSASTFNALTGEGTVYFESVCMFILFLLGARYFELKSRIDAMNAAQSIGYVKPMIATRLSADESSRESVAAIDLTRGDKILILPGETIPADARVVSGRSGVDESVLTGESRPIHKLEGDMLIGGSINNESPLVAEVTATGNRSVLAEINRLLNRALSGKPTIGLFANRVAGWFVGAVLVLATSVSLFWWLRGNSDWLEITVAVLVVSCPCALSMAVPTAISSSISSLMRRHILITREHALETLPKVSLFAFDKTGTLTEGQPKVVEIRSFHGSDKQNLQLAAALETASEHPLGQAIRNRLGTQPSSVAREFENHPGEGVSAIVGNTRYYIGKPEFVLAKTGQTPAADASTKLSATHVVLAHAEGVLAEFVLDDALRGESQELVDELKERGYKLAILSGDSQAAADEVAKKLGIETVVGNCRPEQKLAQVKQWQEAGEVVAMLGDGINDAPVLAGADLSMSVAGATPVAVASADVVVLSGTLMRVADTLLHSIRTIRIVKQNLAWALAYNSFAIPFAAMGLIAPWLAALGMSLSSIIVVANASRLRR